MVSIARVGFVCVSSIKEKKNNFQTLLKLQAVTHLKTSILEGSARVTHVPRTRFCVGSLPMYTTFYQNTQLCSLTNIIY